MPSIQCSKCDKKYNVKSKYAGKRIACPNCKAPIHVPDVEPEPVIDAAPVSPQADAPFASDVPSFDETGGQPNTQMPSTSDPMDAFLSGDTASASAPGDPAWDDLGSPPAIATPYASPPKPSRPKPSAPTPAQPKSNKLGLIIGGVAGGIVTLLAAVGLIVWLIDRGGEAPTEIAAVAENDPSETVANPDSNREDGAVVGTTPSVSPGDNGKPPVTTKRKAYGGSGIIALTGRPGADGVLPPVPDPLPVAKDGTQSYDMDFNSNRNEVCVISNALISYEKANRRYPATRSADKSNEIQLSWRVEILPYIGHQQLYDRFDKTKPWDSDANLPLLKEMPEQFRVDGDASNSTTTRVCLFLHPRMVFDGSSNEINVNMNRIRDVLQTIVIGGVVGKDKAVPWTKPVDFEVDFSDFVNSLGDIDEDIDLFTLKGRVLRLPATLHDNIFIPLLTRDGGEPIDFARYQRWAAAHYRVPFTSEGLMVNDEAQKIALLHRVMTYHWDKQTPVPAETVFDVATRTNAPSSNLSWRVHLLRNLDYGDLHTQFRFSEPWDSPHNLELAKQMPEIYRDAAAAHDSTTTRIMGLVSPESMLTPDKLSFDLRTVKDRPEDTILLIQAPQEKAVPWTKPEDFTLDPIDPLVGIRPIPETGLLTAFASGKVNYLISTIDESSFHAMATRAGRDIVNPSLFFKYKPQ